MWLPLLRGYPSTVVTQAKTGQTCKTWQGMAPCDRVCSAEGKTALSLSEPKLRTVSIRKKTDLPDQARQLYELCLQLEPLGPIA